MNASQFRRANGRQRGQCTWCGKPVGKGRRTWCSDACGEAFYRQHDWTYIRRQVLKRDQGICAHCGFDALKVKRIWDHLRRRGAFEYRKHYMDFMSSMGFHSLIDDLWQAHHIKPRSQGGTHDLANLETVCVACHKIENARQAAERAAARSVASAASQKGSRPAQVSKGMWAATL